MAKKKPCTRCGRELAQVNYYKSYSEININADRLSICKDCLNDIYELYYNEFEDDMKATYKVCIKTDTYFDIKLFETSKEKYQESNMSLINYYFSKVGLSQYKGKTFTDGDFINIWDKKVIKIKPKVDENKITDEMVSKWGKGYTVEDYMYLEDRYNQMCKSYGDKNISSTWDYQEIALNYLQIKKLREMGDEKSIATATKLMGENSKLMKDCEMKSSQQKASDTDTFSDFISMIELTEPCDKPLPFFDDIDRCEYYFKRFVKEPLAISLDMGKIEDMDKWEDYDDKQ